MGRTCAESEKQDKVRAHKKFRRKSKNILNHINKVEFITPNSIVYEEENPIDTELDTLIIPKKLNDVSNVADFSKDGKKFINSKESIFINEKRLKKACRK